MLLSVRKPLTPKVDGKSSDTPFHTPGILLTGQLMPVMKSRGTEVNTTSSITFSR